MEEIFDYLPTFCQKYYYDYEYFLNGQLQINQLWVLLIIVIIIVLIYEEVYNEIPDYSITCDSEKEVIDNILDKIRSNHTHDVNWRRSLIVALITAFLITYILVYPFEIPPGFVYFFIVIILFGCIYFATAWTSCHWWRMIDYQIEDYLLELRHNLNDYI